MKDLLNLLKQQGQVEGFDAMLRAPNGCFEQTSSSTYPNVMVLQYLKGTGQVTPQIEQQAVDYIAKGYQRLLSFEVPGGGYSLSRRAAEVSVAEILEVMREPVGLVDCCPGAQRTCSHERSCPMKDPLQRLNAVVIQALQGLTLGELVSAA